MSKSRTIFLHYFIIIGLCRICCHFQDKRFYFLHFRAFCEYYGILLSSWFVHQVSGADELQDNNRAKLTDFANLTWLVS